MYIRRSNKEKYSELGWNIEYIKTDKQEGTINEFIEKEGKWFNYIRGNSGIINTADLSFQGLGVVLSTSGGGDGGGNGNGGNGNGNGNGEY